ncbi:siderophore-interacting protein [Thalassospira sp. MA62]|nr:siderophore-interacting protein [Thalassospira sp. MA62]
MSVSVSVLTAKTTIAMKDVDGVIARVADFYKGYDFDVIDQGDATRIPVPSGHFDLAAVDDGLSITVGASSDVDVIQLKTAIISILQGIAPDADYACRWIGAGRGNGRLPNFVELTVGAMTDLGPHMRRLRLHCDDLGAYVSDSLHVRLLIPPRGVDAPEWPVLGENGMPVWPKGDKAVEQRVYTIRAIDADAGWMDVDFVMHGDNGPGSAFAQHAAPGDLVAMTGPLGNALPEMDWILLAGDETALPMIARYLEELPATTRGHAIIEVGSKADIIPLHTDTAIDIVWLLRDGDTPVERSLMQDAVRAIDVPVDECRVYCLAGVEQGDYKPLHQYWRKELGLTRDQCLAMTFWRKTKST